MLYWSIFKINHRSADNDVAAGLQAQAKKQTKKNPSIITASSALMAFMKDDTTTSTTRVFAPLGHNWFFQIKAFICWGAYFVCLNGDADVNLNTSDQKEENILWQRVSEPAFRGSAQWNVGTSQARTRQRMCSRWWLWWLSRVVDFFFFFFFRVPNKSISWRILDNRRCRPTSDEVQSYRFRACWWHKRSENPVLAKRSRRDREQSQSMDHAVGVLFSNEKRLFVVSPPVNPDHSSRRTRRSLRSKNSQ